MVREIKYKWFSIQAFRSLNPKVTRNNKTNSHSTGRAKDTLIMPGIMNQATRAAATTNSHTNQVHSKFKPNTRKKKQQSSGVTQFKENREKQSKKKITTNHIST